MTLPNDFQFSQGSLQDYVDCPRRFQLRHVDRLAWPAPEAEPALENEIRLRQGASFHRLVHQHALGLPVERLSDVAAGEGLSVWWQNYLDSGPPHLPASSYPETTLSAPVRGYRLVAKYDLIAVEQGRRAIIVDWKTSLKRPQRRRLVGRLQTRVYPTLLVLSGSALNGDQPVEPGQVEMIYWFANHPADPETFVYDDAQCEADQVYLATLIDEMEGQEAGNFPLVEDARRCQYCSYRSLCQRGIRAGLLDDAEQEPELEDEFDFELDFEHIAEIEY